MERYKRVDLEFATTEVKFSGFSKTTGEHVAVRIPYCSLDVLEPLMHEDRIIKTEITYPLKGVQGRGYIMTLTKN